MNTFSNQLQTKFPEIDFGAYERVHKSCQQSRLEEYRAAEFSPVAKIPFKARTVFQVGLRRNLELSASFIASFNGELFIPLFVISRAILETGCLLWDLDNRIAKSLQPKEPLPLDQLDNHLGKVLLGAKTNEWAANAEKYPAPNILTILDRLKKSSFPEIRDHYDVISEFAHPNYAGMQAIYVKNDKVNRLSEFNNSPFQECSSLLPIALGAAGVGMQMTAGSISSYEAALRSFVQLCDEDIRAGGNWPSEVPWPWGLR